MAAEAGVQEQSALPVAKFPVVHKVVSLASLKITVPVAPEVTAAVKVTELPNVGEEFEALCVAVVAVFTTTLAAVELDPVYAALPA